MNSEFDTARAARVIARKMAEKDMTFVRLAQLTGFPKSCVYGWATGRNQPLASSSVILARALGLTVEEIWGEEVLKNREQEKGL